MAELKPGDRIATWFGPYRAVATVRTVTEHGAVLDLPELAVLIGWDKPEFAPDGTQLTENGRQGWLGRAHFATAEVLEPAPSLPDRFERERDAERGGP